MGQAKKRGNQAQRISEAQEREREYQAHERARYPDSVKCNKCQLELTDLQIGDCRDKPGLEQLAVAHCNNCQHDTWIIQGTPLAIEITCAALVGDRFRPDVIKRYTK